MDIDDVKNLYGSKLHIHFHLCKAAACGNGIFLHLCGHLCCQHRGIAETVIGFLCQRLQRKYLFLSCVDPAVIQRQFSCLLLRKKGFGIVQNLLEKLFCALLHSCSGNKGLAGCICACVKRRHIGILYCDNMDVLHIHVKCLCRHLGKDGICSLADLCSSDLKLNASVLVHGKPGACNFQ